MALKGITHFDLSNAILRSHNIGPGEKVFMSCVLLQFAGKSPLVSCLCGKTTMTQAMSLEEIAIEFGISDRSARRFAADLVKQGYLVAERDGRRSATRYGITRQIYREYIDRYAVQNSKRADKGAKWEEKLIETTCSACSSSADNLANRTVSVRPDLPHSDPLSAANLAKNDQPYNWVFFSAKKETPEKKTMIDASKCAKSATAGQDVAFFSFCQRVQAQWFDSKLNRVLRWGDFSREARMALESTMEGDPMASHWSGYFERLERMLSNRETGEVPTFESVFTDREFWEQKYRDWINTKDKPSTAECKPTSGDSGAEDGGASSTS